jgi:hypothetical protein
MRRRTRPDRNSESGFTNVTSIVIGKGEITDFKYPECEKTPLLSQLVNRSPRDSYLTELHINDNHVSSLDLKGLTGVGAELLNNELVSIENLPQ